MGNPFIDRRMRRAVDYELESRGFRRVDERPAPRRPFGRRWLYRGLPSAMGP